VGPSAAKPPTFACRPGVMSATEQGKPPESPLADNGILEEGGVEAGSEERAKADGMEEGIATGPLMRQEQPSHRECLLVFMCAAMSFAVVTLHYDPSCISRSLH